MLEAQQDGVRSVASLAMQVSKQALASEYLSKHWQASNKQQTLPKSEDDRNKKKESRKTFNTEASKVSKLMGTRIFLSSLPCQPVHPYLIVSHRAPAPPYEARLAQSLPLLGGR